jgi:hypothetical protein
VWVEASSPVYVLLVIVGITAQDIRLVWLLGLRVYGMLDQAQGCVVWFGASLVGARLDLTGLDDITGGEWALAGVVISGPAW